MNLIFDTENVHLRCDWQQGRLVVVDEDALEEPAAAHPNTSTSASGRLVVVDEDALEEPAAAHPNTSTSASVGI
ncbi:hypothetical protein LIER_17091 [Lithospermum erythrorhizon]|uniref:Uncharacterized protein n=1 Tax=Lithospermum erythrorhizon TaxID=34254 RepID=A0AAV3QBM7_LITER